MKEEHEVPDGLCISKVGQEPEMENYSQPATQPLSENEDSDDCEKMDLDDSWGWLFPNVEGFTRLSLQSDEISVGRSQCNTYVFKEHVMGSKRFLSSSKVHFVISKASESIYISDRSSNGTFVNGVLIGKNKKRILEHNSTIAISELKYKAFVFILKAVNNESLFPSLLTDKYIVSRELGSGAAGVVRLGFRLYDNTRVAIKSISKKNLNYYGGKEKEFSSKKLMNEVSILQSLNHPNIIKLVDFIDTADFLFIVLEIADGGELFDKILELKRFSESDAKLHFYQIASAIQYLHSKNIAHRDLKPENILLSSSDGTPLVKISDMGLSKFVHFNSVLQTFCGTPQYLAPEVLSAQMYHGVLQAPYSHKVDCWSLGVILYILLSGRPPFHSDPKNGKDLVNQILSVDFSFKERVWSSVSKNAIHLISSLLTSDVSSRLSADEILAHPWLDPEDDFVSKAIRIMRENEESTVDGIRKRKPSCDSKRENKKIKWESSRNEDSITPPLT